MEQTLVHKILLTVSTDRWKKIQQDQNLQGDAEVLDLLLRHYENTLQGVQTVAYCGACLAPLQLICPRCPLTGQPPVLSGTETGDAVTQSGGKPLLPEAPEMIFDWQAYLPADASDEKSADAINTPPPHTLGGEQDNVAEAVRYLKGGGVTAFAGLNNQSDSNYASTNCSTPQQAQECNDTGTGWEDAVSNKNKRKVKTEWDNMTAEELQPELERIIEKSEYGTKEFSLFVSRYLKVYTGKCPFCHKNMSDKKDNFQRHLVTHMPNPKLKCNQCHMTFPSTTRRYQHMRKVHKGGQKVAPTTPRRLKRPGEVMPETARIVVLGSVSEPSHHVQLARGEGEKVGSDSVRAGRPHQEEHEGGQSGFPGSQAEPTQKEEVIREEEQNVCLRSPDGRSTSQHVPVLKNMTRKNFITKWDNMTAEEMQTELMRIVGNNEYQSLEFSLFVSKYLKIYTGQCPLCHKQISERKDNFQRHLVSHMPNPKVKCSWCDMTFLTVHRRYKHERRVHKARQNADPASPSKRRRKEEVMLKEKQSPVPGRLGKPGQVALDRRESVDPESLPRPSQEVGQSGFPGSPSQAVKQEEATQEEYNACLRSEKGQGAAHPVPVLKNVVSKNVVTKWDNMTADEMKPELFRIVEKSDCQSREFSLFISKYLKVYSSECPYCHKWISKRKENFQRHLITHMPNPEVKCNLCNMTFISVHRRYRHERKVHKEGQEVKLPKQKVNSNDVTKWDKMTSEELQLELVRIVEKSEYQSAEFSVFLDKYLKVYTGKCPFCHKMISKKKDNFQRHLVIHMPNPEVKCSLCNMSFLSTYRRYRHERKVHKEGQNMDTAGLSRLRRQRMLLLKARQIAVTRRQRGSHPVEQESGQSGFPGSPTALIQQDEAINEEGQSASAFFSSQPGNNNI